MKSATRPRLYGKDQPRLPKPKLGRKSDKGFSLRLASEADSRFAVVKQMRSRLKKLVEDCQPDTVGQEWLCGRAVHILTFIESLEIAVLEGEQIDHSEYLRAVNALSNLLSKLDQSAAERRGQSTITLEEHLASKGKSK